MRPILLLSPLALVACVEVDANSGPDPATVALQEAACRTTIADHVRRPESEVAVRWLSQTDGIATVETLDGNRRHTCAVDATGRVLSYDHPDA